MSSAKMDQLGLSNGKEITAFVGQLDSAAEYTFSKPLGAFDQGESGLPQPKDDPDENLDVQMQHTVLMERDGFAMELDEQTNLQVPMFWEPPAGSDQLDHVDMIDGQPTIFLMIASYRDWQCRDTATSALERATFPGRVVVAAVQQNRPGDVGCGEPPKPCSEEPSQPLCARAKQVKVYAMDANEVTGNVLISLLLRSESCCAQSWIHAKPNTSADILIN
jgi:hypothetical protein